MTKLRLLILKDIIINGCLQWVLMNTPHQLSSSRATNAKSHGICHHINCCIYNQCQKHTGQLINICMYNVWFGIYLYISYTLIFLLKMVSPVIQYIPRSVSILSSPPRSPNFPSPPALLPLSFPSEDILIFNVSYFTPKFQSICWKYFRM